MTEVHFCNLCNQSVPQDQVDDGSAIRHGGRIVCATCRDVMAMASTGEKAKSSRAALLVPLSVGLIGWGAAAYVWFELQDLRGHVDMTAAADATRIADRLQRVGDELGDRLDALALRAEGMERGLEGVRADAARHAEAVQTQMLALEKSAERIPDLADGIERVEGQVREAQTARTLLEQDVRDLRGAVEVLRAGLAGVQQKVAAGPAAADPAGFLPEVEDLLAKLRDPDPLTRSLALEKLRAFRDPRLVPFVEPLLKDSYEMNRFYAATNLGDWKATGSLAALVEALNDEYSFVRKAANDALVGITGQDQSFDPKSSEAERRKGYERWKQWLALQAAQPAST